MATADEAEVRRLPVEPPQRYRYSGRMGRHPGQMAFASLVGGVTAFLGFWIAYQWDLPVGPTDVVLLGAFYAVAWLAAQVFNLHDVRKS